MEKLVFKNDNGQPATNSLVVAQKFGKRHADVLRAVKKILQDMSEITENEHERFFAVASQLVELPNGGWREEYYYVMNRDGFALLVLGFTGKEALRFKIDFIDAFNRMEGMIRQGMMGNEEIKKYIREAVDERFERKYKTQTPAGIGGGNIVVRDDYEARKFFNEYRSDPEKRWLHLERETIEISYANACVLNAIRDKMAEMYHNERRRLKKINKGIFWNQAVRLTQQVDIYQWPHSLPANPRRLCAKYYRYVDEGYKSLIHGGMNNQHARKRK
jgi:Rha family phage regulatory protein